MLLLLSFQVLHMLNLFFDNTIQVDLMLMQIHPIILFLSDLTVDGTNTDTGSIATNSTMMILCC